MQHGFFSAPGRNLQISGEILFRLAQIFRFSTYKHKQFCPIFGFSGAVWILKKKPCCAVQFVREIARARDRHILRRRGSLPAKKGKGVKLNKPPSKWRIKPQIRPMWCWNLHENNDYYYAAYPPPPKEKTFGANRPLPRIYNHMIIYSCPYIHYQCRCHAKTAREQRLPFRCSPPQTEKLFCKNWPIHTLSMAMIP